ncbi:MAG: type 2 isopentenyl-diphosphate Delta-isomerase [Patescibacteria group bacterium]|nr:type 2 isopentenyl-diphosphate Delta-isomerase [Patescibacteria group bacterium]
MKEKQSSQQETDKTAKRKLEHIKICLEENVQSTMNNGFERISFKSSEKPGINPEKTDIVVSFLGRKFNAPIFIEAITGGAPGTEKINKNLATAGQKLGIGMAVGSQRAMLENPEIGYTYQVRDAAPDIFLLANIGIAQVLQYSPEQIESLVKAIKADGLAVHFNISQEMAQKEGDKDFSGIYEALARLCFRAKFPVIAKEVGFGMTGDMAKQLENSGVAAIDVAGAGGTDWRKIELLRSNEIDENYSSEGIPTALSLEQCLNSVKIPVISSGGIRTATDIAKSLAMGAALAGMALPLLKPATVSAGEVVKKLKEYILGLKKIMAGLGAENIKELGKVILEEEIKR